MSSDINRRSFKLSLTLLLRSKKWRKRREGLPSLVLEHRENQRNRIQRRIILDFPFRFDCHSKQEAPHCYLSETCRVPGDSNDKWNGSKLTRESLYSDSIHRSTINNQYVRECQFKRSFSFYKLHGPPERHSQEWFFPLNSIMSRNPCTDYQRFITNRFLRSRSKRSFSNNFTAQGLIR